MTRIYPLIICGGNGTRLWPLSRTQSPKQFQRIGGPDSLSFFQTAVRRHQGPVWADPIVVTGAQHRGVVVQQLREIQVQATILCEPEGRNTGPAVLAATEVLMQEDPEAVMVVIPADHVIEGPLSETIAACVPAVEAGHIITLGIQPRYPETGFGYITEAGPLAGFDGISEVGGFVEKPPLDVATRLFESGKAYWASGLSMFSATTILEEYKRFDPETVAAVAEAVFYGDTRDGALYLDPNAFARAHDMPTEQAVFERTDRIALAPLPVQWDDVGSWRAMYSISAADGDGNVLQGDVIAKGARNTMVRSDSRLVSVVGLEDVVVIDTPDALLVAHMDDSQDVKKVVADLKARARPEAEHHAAAKPAMVPVQTTEALAQLVSTDRFHIGTAEIGVGRSIEMDRGPASRQVIVVSGMVEARGPRWKRKVGEGERIFADPASSVRIFNLGDEPAELLYLTLEAPTSEAPEPRVARHA